MTASESDTDELHLCVEHIYWDLIDIFDIPKGRKNELTFVTGLIIHLSTVTRLRMQDIARMFDVSRSTVTDYVDYLERKGYVRRVRGKDDKRDVYVEPTQKGRSWVSKFDNITQKYADDGVSRLTPEEREIFLRLLVKFVGDFEKPPYDKMLREREKQES
jgi:DNA-binding MarR family transcriptional regulator